MLLSVAFIKRTVCEIFLRIYLFFYFDRSGRNSRREEPPLLETLETPESGHGSEMMDHQVVASTAQSPDNNRAPSVAQTVREGHEVIEVQILPQVKKNTKTFYPNKRHFIIFWISYYFGITAPHESPAITSTQKLKVMLCHALQSSFNTDANVT